MSIHSGFDDNTAHQQGVFCRSWIFLNVMSTGKWWRQQFFFPKSQDWRWIGVAVTVALYTWDTLVVFLPHFHAYPNRVSSFSRPPASTHHLFRYDHSSSFFLQAVRSPAMCNTKRCTRLSRLHLKYSKWWQHALLPRIHQYLFFSQHHDSVRWQSPWSITSWNCCNRVERVGGWGVCNSDAFWRPVATAHSAHNAKHCGVYINYILHMARYT